MRLSIAQETELQIWGEGPMTTPPPHIESLENIFTFTGWELPEGIEIDFETVKYEGAIVLSRKAADRFVEKLYTVHPTWR